jgi:hypothetical protein
MGIKINAEHNYGLLPNPANFSFGLQIKNTEYFCKFVQQHNQTFLEEIYSHGQVNRVFISLNQVYITFKHYRYNQPAAALGHGQVGHCPTKSLKKHKSFVVLLSVHYNFLEGFMFLPHRYF